MDRDWQALPPMVTLKQVKRCKTEKVSENYCRREDLVQIYKNDALKFEELI